MQRQRIELCGVSVELETEHDPFARYVAGQFPAGRPAGCPPGGPPDLLVRVRWTEGELPALTPAAVFPGWSAETRVDRHVWLAPGRLLCLRLDDAPQLAIASEPGDPRRFELRFHFAPGAGGWRTAVQRLLRPRRLARLRRHRLSTLTYYAVYYPVWWHLEARGLAHPLHAAGVAVDGRGLLLGGLPGCGKSTLATSLLGVPGAELLADNVVLHDGAQIHGCFEPLLLDDATRARLTDRVPLVAIGRRHQYARDAYAVAHRTGGVPLAAAVVVARARTTRLTPLPPGECARLLLAINEAAKEIRRYHILAALFGLVERDSLVHLEQRVTHLDRLLAGVPCYWLDVREGAPAEAVVALRDLFRPAQQEVTR